MTKKIEQEHGLKSLFHNQHLNDSVWHDKEKFQNDRNYRMEVVKDFVLGIYDQTAKLMNTFQWKKHTLEAVEDHQNAIEQLIDINKYTIGMLNMLGVSPEQYEMAFALKSNILQERWAALAEKMTEETRVICFDIDGVIADYDNAYKKYLADVCRMFPKEIKRDSYSYYKLYGITKIEEESLHADFIKAGGFQNIEPYWEMVDLMRKIKMKGWAKIVLLTARPSWVYQRLITDTYSWLKQHSIPYDVLLWDKDKADTMVQYIFPANVLFFIEDRDKHAIEITHLGVDVLLVDKEYNKNMPDSEHIIRVDSISRIQYLIQAKLKKLELI